MRKSIRLLLLAYEL